jgi:hypothetical protein
VAFLSELDTQQLLVEPPRPFEVVDGDVDHHDAVSLWAGHRDSLLDELV